MDGESKLTIDAIIPPEDLDNNLGLYHITSDEVKKTFSNVVLASAVTAYGRIREYLIIGVTILILTQYFLNTLRTTLL